MAIIERSTNIAHGGANQPQAKLGVTAGRETRTYALARHRRAMCAFVAASVLYGSDKSAAQNPAG